MRPQVLVGEIRLIGSSYAPAGWLTCDGATVKVADQPELFKAIGATYGGDGKTNFALPNFQAQVPIHISSGMRVGQAGQGSIKLPRHAAELRYIIAARSEGWSDPFLGEIRDFAFNFGPKDWGRCEGQLLSISQNTALFSLFSTRYGGDGARTFAIPDLRGTEINGDGLRCVGTNFCVALNGVYPSRG